MIMDSTPAEISGTALALRGSARSSQVAGGSARNVLPRVPSTVSLGGLARAH